MFTVYIKREESINPAGECLIPNIALLIFDNDDVICPYWIEETESRGSIAVSGTSGSVISFDF